MTEGITWRCFTTVTKYRVTEKGLHVPDNAIQEAMPHLDMYDQIHVPGNVLTYGGASALWHRLISETPSVNEFDESATVIGVGTSSTAASPLQTDLQAVNDASNRHFVGMESSYPAHSHGTGAENASCTFYASFGTSAGNFTWREFGVGLGTAGAGGSGSFSLMLNRKVHSFGTKTSSDTWDVFVGVSIS